MFKKTILIISFIFTVYLAVILIISFYLLKTISNQTHTPITYFPKLISEAKNHPSISNNINFIILGLDPRDDQLEKTTTTDTIILANLSKNWNINLISLPRDLWSYSLNNKINQIYPLSLSSPDKYKYIQDNFGQITGQPIDRTIVMTTSNLITLTDLVGGVDVYLDNGFIDNQYPNPEYINNPKTKVPVYKTVEFSPGWNHLNKNNITEFVRSRKSSDSAVTGGTDLGRINRQQLLINALLEKIKSSQFIGQPKNIIALYNFWHTQINTNLTDQDLISIAIQGYSSFPQLKLNRFTLPTGENSTFVIYHPQKFINQQWVFIPQDKDYKSFQQFISTSLNNAN